MTHMKRISLCLVAVVIVAICLPASAFGDPLVITAATDKSEYVRGELLYVDATVHNPNAYSVTLHFGATVYFNYTMDSTYTTSLSGAIAMIEVTIPAGQSHTFRQRHHSWSEYDIAPGTHSVVVTMEANYGQSEPYYFEVVEPVLPTEDVLIDFDILPDGRPMDGPPRDAYAAWGVHFHQILSDGTQSPSLNYTGSNLYLVTWSTTYPPGFNIVATFDMPVYGVSADVSTAAGRTITMIAKDSGGNVIGTTESDPVPASGSFVPIEIYSITPVASVEFWPSQETAAVMLDNLDICLHGGGYVGPVTLTVETDQAKYYPDEPIEISITAHNPNDYDMLLQFNTSLQGYYIIDDVFQYPDIALQVLTQQLVPAEGSYTWSYTHNWEMYDLGLGVHTVVGGVNQHGVTDAISFEVVEPQFFLGDLNHDLVVDIVDLNIVLIHWDPGPPYLPIPDPRADVNHDLIVDVMDINAVLIDWGKTGYAPK